MNKSPRQEKSPWLHRGRLRDVVVILCVISALVFPLNIATLCAGLAMLAFGCLLHVVVKGQLIRNVVLCTEGTYAVVRHPYYLANYLIDTSFCLLSGNVFLLVLYPFLFFWAYEPTLLEEESRLASLHGSDFEAYRARVPQIFPNATVFAGFFAATKNFSMRRVTPGELKRLLRFGFIGSFLILVHHLGFNGLKKIVADHNPLTPSDLALAAVCALLLISSTIIPRRSKATSCSEDP